MKAVEIYLKPEQCGIELERKTITNIKYYVAMMVSISLAGGKENVLAKLSAFPAISITPELLSESLETVLNSFNDLGATDQVAKGSELVGKLLC